MDNNNKYSLCVRVRLDYTSTAPHKLRLHGRI